MRSALFAFSLALLVILIAIPPTSSTRKDNEWIIDEMTPNLLRFNLKGQLISSDLSEYIHFKCSGEGEHRTCEIDQDNLDLKISDPSQILQPSDDGTIQSYGTGVAMYAVIAFAAAVLVIICTALYLLGTACCLMATCCMKKDETKVPKSRFTKKQRDAGTATLVFCFFAFLATVIILSYVLGVKEILSGVSEVPDAPFGVAQIAYKFSLATQPLFIGMVSTIMLPTLRNVNNTVDNAVNWQEILEDLEEINHLVSSLPNLNNIEQSLNDIDVNLDELNQNIDDINNYNSNYEAQKDDVRDTSDTVLADLQTLQTALDDLEDATAAAQTSVTDLQGYWTDLYGADGPESYTASDQDGLVDSVQYDIDRTDRDDTPGEGVPTESTLNDAATGASASMARLLSGDLDGAASETADLVTKLQGIYASIVALPDYSVTATNLQSIQDIVDDLRTSGGLIDSLPGQLDDIQAALDAMPDTETMKADVQALVDAVNAINGDSLTDILTETNTNIQEILDEMGDILNELSKVSDVLQNFTAPIHDLLVEQPKVFNRTIMELPYNATDIYTSIADVLTSSSVSIDDALSSMQTSLDTLQDQVDLTSFINTVDEALTSYHDKLDTIDQDGLDDALDSAKINSTSYDTTAYKNSIADATTSLSNVDITQAVIDGFNDLQTLRMNLEEALRDAVGQSGTTGSDGTAITEDGEYLLLVQGVCGVDDTTYCSVDGDCTSGTCDHIAEFRCAADGSTFTVCTDDSDCTNGHCLADTTRATNLQSALTALADSSTTSFGQDSVDGEFDDLRTTSAAVNLGQLSTDLSDIQTDITDADTTSYQQSVEDLQDDLDDPDYSFTDYLIDLDDAQDDIDKINVAEYNDNLGDVQDKIDEYGDRLDDVIGFCDSLATYFHHDDGLKFRFSQLEKPVLEDILENDGFGPVLMHVGQTFEGASDDVIDMLRNNSFKRKRVEMTKDLREPARYMDRFTANPHRGFYDLYEVGAFYYMMQLTNDTAERMVDAHDPMADTITTDKNGDTYPDDKICVTRTCFENQQAELEDLYGQYFPIVVALPAIVALIALGNFACIFIPAEKTRCCRRCMPHWLLCMIIVILPWYLIFSGLFFTWFIALSDGCTAGPKIAANYISAYGDDLCAKFDGVGTLEECVIAGNDFEVSVNIRRMTNIALGLETCSGNNEDDPFYVPMNRLANQMRSSALERTTKEITKRKYRKYRQNVKNIVYDFSDGSSLVARNFVNDIGDDVITCETVGDVIEYMTAPVCYSLVGPGTWLVATIYLAAWAMCCLGIPAGCALKNSFKWDDIEHIQSLHAEDEEVAGEEPAGDAEAGAGEGDAAAEGGGGAVGEGGEGEVQGQVRGGEMVSSEDNPAYAMQDEESLKNETRTASFYRPVMESEEDADRHEATAGRRDPPPLVTGYVRNRPHGKATSKDYEKLVADGMASGERESEDHYDDPVEVTDPSQSQV